MNGGRQTHRVQESHYHWLNKSQDVLLFVCLFFKTSINKVVQKVTKSSDKVGNTVKSVFQSQLVFKKKKKRSHFLAPRQFRVRVLTVQLNNCLSSLLIKMNSVIFCSKRWAEISGITL